VEIATIGFTKSSARFFFERLTQAGLPTLIDIRLHNQSQLAGFAKRDDLEFFLERICDMDYRQEPLLAPDEDLLKGYRGGTLAWKQFAGRYRTLIEDRKPEQELERDLYERGVVLLCSEATAERCHRRLAAEYLAERWGGVRIMHL
jgi:uncharacterized protein (DUF488 family)